MRLGSRRRVVALAAVLVSALGALNVTGVLPIPVGPLGDRQSAARDNAGSTVNYDTARRAVYLTALVENTGMTPVTVVGVSPVGVTVPGSVEVLGSM
ncbi:MAG: hypothetical protein ACYDAN_11610, partial [Candidatus Limnocylindrales bacterium]